MEYIFLLAMTIAAGIYFSRRFLNEPTKKLVREVGIIGIALIPAYAIISLLYWNLSLWFAVVIVVIYAVFCLTFLLERRRLYRSTRPERFKSLRFEDGVLTFQHETGVVTKWPVPASCGLRSEANGSIYLRSEDGSWYLGHFVN